MIPRVLHYMFVSPTSMANLSVAYDYWLGSCIRANPGYRIFLWSSDECTRLAERHHADLAPAYANLSQMGAIRQADFCRLMVLSTYGGIYLDFDVLCTRSFDPLLSLGVFVADEPDEHKKRWRRRTSSIFISNALMGSEAGHPFWKTQLDLFAKRCAGWKPGMRAVMTGPHMMSAAWRLLQSRAKKKGSRGPAPPPAGAALLPAVTFFPVAARVERARAFDEPRHYPNETIAAHQWAHAYSGGRLHKATERHPLPPEMQLPYAPARRADGTWSTRVEVAHESYVVGLR